MICEVCKEEKECISSLTDGVYYKSICRSCVGANQQDSIPTSGAAGFDRRRQYEDHAADVVQPYTASGPNSEFFRLYPTQSEKIFGKQEIQRLKKQV